MMNAERQNEELNSDTESEPQQEKQVVSSDGVEVHPESLKAARKTAEQFKEALKELAKR